jgi:membrane-bound lytic murein transglycosylase A
MGIMPRFAAIPACLLPVLVALLGGGCASSPAERPAGPAYDQPLPPGASALRLVTDPARYPDVRPAYERRNALLLAAIDESLVWFEAPSSRRHFPFESITHERARASLVAMRGLLESSPSAEAFAREVRRRFDVYESVGYDQRGTVLFTGYYAPIFRASRVRTERFAYPLYRRPDDLVTDPLSGAPRGRRTSTGAIEPYPTRAEIEASGRLAGTELVWLGDALSAYLVHVNGSAKLRLTDGSVMHVGYAGKTDRPYESLGRAMADAGLVDPTAVSLAAIRRAFRAHPDEVRELMTRNENYVFFTECAPDLWPVGSLGVKVTAQTSLATDKAVFPRGGLMLVDTDAVSLGSVRPFDRFMLDQDTGGAIRAPGRADIFMGVGPGAEIMAGGQYAEGRMYYLFLKE